MTADVSSMASRTGENISAHEVLFDGEKSILKYFDTMERRYALVNQPMLPFSLVASYVLFCVWLGPKWMKNRSPFHLNKLIFVYDFCLVIINAYLALSFAKYCFTLNWDFHCPSDVKTWVKEVLRETHSTFLYFYLSKFVELLDTIFFVLRKKSRNISFLHVFHHSTVPLGMWMIINYDPSAFYWITIAAVNSFTHILMYAYYGLASIGYNKIFRWKKYLTTIQISQFLLQIIYMLFLLSCGCIHFREGCVFGCSVLLIICLLFLNFYRRNFVKTKSKKFE